MVVKMLKQYQAYWYTMRVFRFQKTFEMVSTCNANSNTKLKNIENRKYENVAKYGQKV